MRGEDLSFVLYISFLSFFPLVVWGEDGEKIQGERTAKRRERFERRLRLVLSF